MIPLMMSHPAAEVSADRLTVLKYDLERRSIYVGNLPNDTTVEDFHALFDVHGPITKVTIHKNDSIVNRKFRLFFRPSATTNTSS